MPTYTDVFGGSSVQPSLVQLTQVSISTSIATAWPAAATTLTPLARIMEVTATAASLTVTLPDATLVGIGQDVLFDNAGSNTFTVLDFAGNSIATVAPSTAFYLYLLTNGTQAGTWRVVQFGVGTSGATASQLVGYGLKAIGSSLNQAISTSTISSNYSVLASDRAKLYVNTGASITVTLPLTSSVTNDYFFELRNNGTGTMTMVGTSGEQIDGLSSVVLNINESCMVHAATGAWYTVGRGRNQQFNFSQLNKPVTGGTTTLTLSEASNVVQTYSGTLISNQIVVLPAVVQVYYVTNNCVGSFSFTLKTPNTGTTIAIPNGQSAVVFSDGTNVVNASNTTSGFSTLALNAGSVSSPALSLSAVNNGFYAPSSTTLAAAPAGVEALRWSGTQNLAANGSAAAPSFSFLGYAGTGLFIAGANQIGLAINGTQVLTFSATGLAGLTSTNVTTALGFTPYSAANPSGYITSAGAPVQSVGGNTGAVTSAQVAAAATAGYGFTPYSNANPSGYITSAGAPVQSVGGNTGAITNAQIAAAATAGYGFTPYSNANPSGYQTSSGSVATATNLAGGAAGGVPYQTGSGATSMLAAGTAGQVLTSGGAGAPSWAAVQGVPSGAVFWFAASSAPTGYLECSGAAVSRTTYAALFAVIGTTWGVGDGSTTFNLPQLRGEFIRGYDNGRGVDPGRAFASSQTADIAAHAHLYDYSSIQAGGGTGGVNNITQAANTGGGTFSTRNSTGTETRPRNIAMLPCIKT